MTDADKGLAYEFLLLLQQLLHKPLHLLLLILLDVYPAIDGMPHIYPWKTVRYTRIPVVSPWPTSKYLWRPVEYPKFPSQYLQISKRYPQIPGKYPKMPFESPPTLSKLPYCWIPESSPRYHRVMEPPLLAADNIDYRPLSPRPLMIHTVPAEGLHSSC